MKKIIKSGLLSALATIAILITGCNKDSESKSVLQLVSSTGSNFISDNRTLAGGTPVITGVFAQAATDNQSLAKFKVTFNYDSLDITPPVVYLDSALGPGTRAFSMPVTYTPRNLKGIEIWKFIITDDKGKEYVRDIQLKTTSSNTNRSVIYTYSNVLLRRFKFEGKDSLGLISFASADGTSLPYYVVKQSSIAGKIDLTLNSIITEKPNLTAASVNATSLQMTILTPENFDAINTVVALQESYPKTEGQTRLSNLKANQIIAFKSITSKVGILRIKAIKPNTVDSLLFDVKIEK